MIHWLLRALGMQDANPEPVAVRFPPTEAERNFECVRQEAERVISQADQETERSRQQAISWERLYDDPRRTR